MLYSQGTCEKNWTELEGSPTPEHENSRDSGGEMYEIWFV